MKLFLENELLDAIRESNEDLVESLLQRGANPNAGLLLGGECSLSLALRIGNERVLDLILRYGRGKFQCTNEQRVKDSESPRKSWPMLAIELCGFKVLDVLLKSVAERFTNLADLPTFQALYHPSLWYFSPSRTAWGILLSCVEAWRENSEVDIIVDFGGAIFSLCIYKMASLPKPFLYMHLLPQATLTSWRLILGILASIKLSRHRTHEAEVAEAEAREYYFRLRKDLAPIRNSSLNLDAIMERSIFISHVGNRKLRNSGYRSPATLIFKAISESENVTESMVLKLLSHNLLVHRPYNESSLAQVLLSMAVRRGWPHLTTFLVDGGTTTVRRVSGVCWPSISRGYAYSFTPRLWSYFPIRPPSGPQIHSPHDQYTEGSNIDFFSDLYKSQVFNEILCEFHERIYSTSNMAINKLILTWNALERLDTSGAQDPDLIDVLLSSMAAKGLRNPMFHRFLALWVKTTRRSRRGPFESALFHAVAQRNPHPQIVTDLLRVGFSPHWGTESQPYTPFQIALLKNTDSRTAQLLLDHGAVLGGSMYNESLLMKAVLEQRSFDKFMLLIKLGVSAEPKTLGRVIKGERYKNTTTASLRDLYTKALSDLGLADTTGPFAQNETDTPTTQHHPLDDAKDKAAGIASEPEEKFEESGQSAILADNSLVHGQLSELGSPSCQVATYQKDWEYHIGQTWEQVYGEGRSVRHRGTRGQITWHYKRRTRLAHIMDWLEREKSFQEDCSRVTDLDAPDPLGATLLMKTCARSQPILVANILYMLGMDRVQGAIHHYDNNDMTAVHYAAAVGDVDALKVLVFPGHLLNRAVNIWRLQDELYRSRRLPSRPKDFKGKYEVSDCVPDSDGPPQPWLDIFEELPEETRDRIELPNINFSEWPLMRSQSCLIPERLTSKGKSRTPLHEAAWRGRLAAVRFLLSYSGIDAGIRDVYGKTAADMALNRDYYDIYNLITTHM
ncbi:hypothetical protein FPHYL_7792 [Fusarium phyllophilum]|uniref:Ankyrin n=1 Tax=Fusarium phyllophilum TaxID=47803 RepID=A0A8H5JKW4_9HYPO|nr:hypothetical protein FPHYL_7792 [Fusarium phyllophilum]